MKPIAFWLFFFTLSLLTPPLEAQLDPDLGYCSLVTQYFSIREDAQVGDLVARLRIGSGGGGFAGGGGVRIALAATASGRNDNELFQFDSASLNVRSSLSIIQLMTKQSA